MKKGIKTTEFVSYLKKIILKGELPKPLTQETTIILHEMMTNYEITFFDYFSDLAVVVSQLVILSENHKKIGAHLVIKNIAKILERKGINLSHQKFEGFYESVIEIFDYLKEKSPLTFPIRINSLKKEIEAGKYKRIVSSKLK